MATRATPAGFIAKVPEKQRTEIARLHTLIRATVPDLKPHVAVYGRQAMLGYGPYHYRYPSGREGDSAVIGLMPRAHGISLYVSGVRDGKYLAETYAPKLGKVDCGKSCIRFRTLDQLDEKALKALFRDARAVTRATPGVSAKA